MHPLDLMIRSQEDLNRALEKTVNMADLAPGGLLAREQINKYIDLSFDRTYALKPGSGVYQHKTDQTKGEVPLFDICEPTTTGTTEHTSTTEVVCAMDARKPIFGKYLYDLVDLKQDWALTYEAIRQNVAKQGLATATQTAMQKSFGNDLENLFWRGDTTTWAASSTATGKLLKQLDGIIVQALDCTSVDICGDAQPVLTGTGKTVTYDHFAALHRHMPQRYQENIDSLEFWISPLLAADYRTWLASLGTDFGNKEKSNKDPISPLGIPVHEVPWMPVDLTGNNNYILLTTKGNMWYAISTAGWERYKRFDQHCRAWFYTTYYAFDCGIRDCAQMVIMNGIKLRQSSSFTI